MTETEAIEALDALSGTDNEALHVNADAILCQFLIDNGHKSIAEAYYKANDRVGFWYG